MVKSLVCSLVGSLGDVEAWTIKFRTCLFPGARDDKAGGFIAFEGKSASCTKGFTSFVNRMSHVAIGNLVQCAKSSYSYFHWICCSLSANCETTILGECELIAGIGVNSLSDSERQGETDTDKEKEAEGNTSPSFSVHLP